mgnify:FL=1
MPADISIIISIFMVIFMIIFILIFILIFVFMIAPILIVLINNGRFIIII